MTYHRSNDEALAVQNEALRRRNGALVCLVQHLGPAAVRIADEQGLIPPPEGETHFSKIRRFVDLAVETALKELPGDHALAQAALEVEDYYADGARARQKRTDTLSANAAAAREAKRRRRAG